MNTHVCLISDQLVPNVLPALVERPDRVALLTSPQMARQADLLRNFLQSRGIACERLPLAAYDFADALAVCAEAIARYGGEGNEVTLNVTGGTKIAALAAYQQFYFSPAPGRRRIIYTDTDNARILELGDEPRAVPLAENLLNVKEYLACYGKSVLPAPGERRGVAAARRDRECTARLCALLTRHPELLRDINRQIARQPENGAPVFVETDGEGPGAELYDLLATAGIAEPSGSRRLCVKTEQNRFYLHGGWLEEYVYNTVADLRAPGLDCRLNVGIGWGGRAAPGRGTTNELDVLFTHGNRLHIISCKTAVLDKESGLGAGALFELDSLKDAAGGLFARTMLVSAHRLRDADFRRAEDLRIKVVSGGDIPRLKALLREAWGIGA